MHGMSTESRPMLRPGPEHEITIEPSADRVQVTVDGAVVADSERALLLREAGHAPVHYFPAEDVDLTLLEPTEHTSWCPYKGEANYFSIPIGGERSVNAVWQYREAFPDVAQIAGYLAFYRDRVEAIVEGDAR
jgi:uncharacterized protein (DUF427 family)